MKWKNYQTCFKKKFKHHIRPVIPKREINNQKATQEGNAVPGGLSGEFCQTHHEELTPILFTLLKKKREWMIPQLML